MSTSTGETCNVHGGTGAILRDQVKLPMYKVGHFEGKISYFCLFLYSWILITGIKLSVPAHLSGIVS